MHGKIGRGIAQEQYQGITKVKVRFSERYGVGTKFSESGIVTHKDKSAAVFVTLDANTRNARDDRARTHYLSYCTAAAS